MKRLAALGLASLLTISGCSHKKEIPPETRIYAIPLSVSYTDIGGAKFDSYGNISCYLNSDSNPILATGIADPKNISQAIALIQHEISDADPTPQDSYIRFIGHQEDVWGCTYLGNPRARAYEFHLTSIETNEGFVVNFNQ